MSNLAELETKDILISRLQGEVEKLSETVAQKEGVAAEVSSQPQSINYVFANLILKFLSCPFLLRPPEVYVPQFNSIIRNWKKLRKRLKPSRVGSWDCREKSRVRQSAFAYD